MTLVEALVVSWQDFSVQAPRLAAFTSARFDDEATGRLTYLSTIRADGGPRVHPVKVFVTDGQAYVFMWGGSPKGNDLKRDPRFALHAAVTPNPFVSGEVAAQGVAELSDDADEWARAAAAAPFAKPPGPDSVLFRLGFTHVMASFAVDGKPQRLRWREADAAEITLDFPTDS
jgi:hypothetical protein